MPLGEMIGDVFLEILACLPLGAIVRVAQVQSAWKKLVDANESHIYHNAAMLHRFVQGTSTTLHDAIHSLEFDTSSFDIVGWKEFCRLRLEIERSWTGFRSSEMRKVALLPEDHYCSKAIPNSDYTISASGLSTIAVQSSADETIWALPEDYLQDFPYFAFDQGYLAFPGHVVDTIDVWREASLETLPVSPSPSQKVAAEASAAVYGSPTAGHFIPCYSLSPIEEAQINWKCLKIMYPTLLSATPAAIHMWDISTGQHLRSLSTKRELDDHLMYHFTGIEISSSYVLAFDERQIRLFSRYDGHFLCHISTSTMFSPNRAVAIQLLPPRHPCSPARQDASALLPQILFAKKNAWQQARSGFYQVALSPCGTVLIATYSNNRLLVIHDLPRMISGDLLARETAVGIKVGMEYGCLLPISPAVSRVRIAVGAGKGIIILTLDHSGSASTGSAQLHTPFGVSSPVRLASSFLCLTTSSTHQLKNLGFVATKLAFDADSRMRPGKILSRYVRKSPDAVCSTRVSNVAAPDEIVSSSTDPGAPPAAAPSVLMDQCQCGSDPWSEDVSSDVATDEIVSHKNGQEAPPADNPWSDDDSMPDLQSVSASSDDEDTEDEDEESDCPSDDDMTRELALNPSVSSLSEDSSAVAASLEVAGPLALEDSDGEHPPSDGSSDWEDSDLEHSLAVPSIAAFVIDTAPGL